MQHAISNRQIFTRFTHWFALGFGSGLSPKAPGTAGTLVAIPIYFLLSHLSTGSYFCIVLLATILGIYLCDVTAKDLGVPDDPRIVWDEIVGYLWTMFLAPSGLLWIGLGFILFRLFDILKPWPIGWCDRRVEGGAGIMLDDCLAAFYAWVCMRLVWGLL